MSETYPVSYKRHGKKYWKQPADYRFASKWTLTPIVAAELSKVVLHYPIAFTKQNDIFIPVVVLSLIPNTNLFVGPDGRWVNRYVPASVRAYPFKLFYTADGQLSLCIDESSNLVTDNSEDYPFYDDAGKVSREIENIKNFLIEYEKSRLATSKACGVIAEKGLFEEWQLKLNMNNKEQKVEGLYKVNEMRMNELPDESFIELKRAGALPFIYAHLYSIGQLNVLKRLIELRFAGKSQPNQPAAKPVIDAEDNGELNLDWDKVLKNLK